MGEGEPKVYGTSQIAAVTSGPSFVTMAITEDMSLETKTALVVVNYYASPPTAEVYRRSTRVPGSWSREIYRWKRKKWVREEKDVVKHPEPPWPPEGSPKCQIDGVDVWSKTELSEHEKQALRILIRRGKTVRS